MYSLPITDLCHFKELELLSSSQELLKKLEELEFTINLHWLLDHVMKSLSQGILLDSEGHFIYELLEDFFREWLTYFWCGLLRALLQCPHFLAKLKQIGAKKGYRYVEMRKLSLIAPNGERIEVESPYFVKALSKKRGRKKKAPMDEGVI